MINMTPLVSAIVLNYRTPLDAVQCVKNLRRQTIKDQIEIIVVDNHSDDDSIGILHVRLADIPNVRIIEAAENLGYGRGNNLGERYATGDYILIVNPDTEPQSDALERFIEVLEKDTEIGIIAPKLVFPDGTVRDSYRTFPTMFDIVIKRTVLRHIFHERLRRYLQHERDPNYVRDTDWVAGACLFLRRSFFEELGGFDERFFLFFDDTDFCRRCWELGKRVVYYPDIKAGDRKQRLSGGGILPLVTKPAGRAHVQSALKYFWKWRKHA